MALSAYARATQYPVPAYIGGATCLLKVLSKLLFLVPTYATSVPGLRGASTRPGRIGGVGR
eukprot:2385141-Rhodomonas_salina.4